jgi:hypothetical protein
MHQLPFGAQMIDKLFRLAQESPGFPMQGTDCVRSIVWAPQSFAVPANAGWLLSTIPRSHAEPERVFIVDGVSFYISADVEPLLRDQVFDWDDNRGVVSHAA